MAKRNTETEIISAYVADNENVNVGAPVPPREDISMTPTFTAASEKLAINRDENKRVNNLGYLEILLDTLPTKGMFYPEGTKISVRAARGEEIKHWSTMNDQDIEQIHLVDDILTYMLERCCLVRMEGVPGNAWKELKQLDKLYLVLAIRDFTFINDENTLKVPYGEGKDISITKDMIDFLDIPQDVMDFYDSTERCFVFDVAGTRICMHIPSVGVNTWLKQYAQAKRTGREMFDEDFIKYAPLLIRDHKKLNVKSYEELVASTRLWGHKEWSVVSYVVRQLEGAAVPKIKYTDENGTEVEIPFNFRGGIKGLFLVSNPLLNLR